MTWQLRRSELSLQQQPGHKCLCRQYATKDTISSQSLFTTPSGPHILHLRSIFFVGERIPPHTVSGVWKLNVRFTNQVASCIVSPEGWDIKALLQAHEKDHSVQTLLRINRGLGERILAPCSMSDFHFSFTFYSECNISNFVLLSIIISEGQMLTCGG